MRLTYRPEIDGLRAIAVILVMLYHARMPGLSGGFVGVDVFFVLSGFLIASRIRDDREAAVFSLRAFWLRRIRRLAPNALLMMGVTLALSTWLLMPNDLVDTSRAAVAQIGVSSNVFFWLKAGYFDSPAVTKPLLHLWSLAVEEQFYLFLPLVFLGAGKRATPLLMALGLTSLVAGVWAASWAPAAGFYLLPFRAWELLLGVALVGRPRLPPVAGLLGLLGILGSAVLLHEAMPFPGVAALPATLGTAALLLSRPSGVFDVLSRPLLVTTGRASYSLYLWHWPALALTRYIAGPSLQAGTTMVVLAGSALLAFAIWRLVEEPIRRRAVPWQVALGSAAVASLLFGSGLWIDRADGLPQRLSPDARTAYEGAMATLEFDHPCLEGPPLDGPTVCASHPSPWEIVVWGDSHARAFMPAVLLSDRPSIRVHCIPLLDVYDSAIDRGIEEARCVEPNRRLLEHLRPGMTVFLVAAWSAHVEGRELRLQGAGQRDALYADADSTDALEVFARALPRTVSAIRERGAKVVLVKQVPQHEAWIANELARALSYGHSPELTRPVQEHRERQARVDQVIDQVALSDSEVIVFDPASVLCTPDCRATANGVALYYDHNHLTVAGAELLFPALQSYWK